MTAVVPVLRPAHQKCRAHECMVGVDLPRVFCGKHWRLLTNEQQTWIFDTHQLNVLLDDQSQIFHKLINEAVLVIGKKEGKL